MTTIPRRGDLVAAPGDATPERGSALPGFLGEIAAIAGREAALGVARAKGGAEKVYIPTPVRLAPSHWLVRAAGWRAAISIAAAIGPARVDIPLGPLAFRRPRSRKMLRYALAKGSSAAEAARLAGVSERTARRYLERMEQEAARTAREPKRAQCAGVG